MSVERFCKSDSASISVSSQNANEIVAAPGANKKIVVTDYTLVADGAVDAKWQSASTDKTGPMKLAAAGSSVAPGHTPNGHFKCGANEALNLHLSAAVEVNGHVSYVVVSVADPSAI